MEFYAKQESFNFDEDTTDTEDDSGIAEVSELSSSVDYANNEVGLDSDSTEMNTPGDVPDQPPQNQDALGRFFSYW